MTHHRDYARERDLNTDRVTFLARWAPVCGTCGKKSYPSRKMAKAVMRILYPGRKMRVYDCGEGFHATSQSAARAARERKHAAVT